MILGYVHIGSDTVKTHRTSYSISSLDHVDTDRPFRFASGFFGVTAIGFVVAFGDLLYPFEIITTAIVTAIFVFAGFQIGQLKFISRELISAKQGNVIWGHHKTLDRLRDEITPRIAASKKGASHAKTQ